METLHTEQEMRRGEPLVRVDPVCAQSCSAHGNPTDCSPRGSPVRGFPKQEYWSGLPLPDPGDLSDLGIGPASTCAGGLFFQSSGVDRAASHIHGMDLQYLWI